MEGLNRQEVEYRENNGLSNEEKVKYTRTTKQIILSNTITLFNILNISLLVLVLTTGSLQNCLFVGTVIFNTIIAIYQEFKSKKILEKLKVTDQDTVTVVREGKKIEIPKEKIVMDDIIYLTSGESALVDMVVMKSSSLEVDESVITGESDAIIKRKDDKIMSGSIVTSGSAYAKVISVGKNNYANNLIKEATSIKDNSSYLQNTINKILKIITFLIVPVGILLFVSQYFYSGQSYNEAILSTVAGIIGIILVLLIMILMYHFSGFIAGTALVVYTMLSFLVFYLIEGTLTLPGIAAMLLGIGMAVDASVISFERIKDQLKIGKPLKEAVAIGNKESLSSILDANITTMIVAVILFILGQSSVKGFATMLIINILLTIIVLVFISKAVIALFAGSGVFDNKVNLFIGLSKKKIIPAKEVRIPFKKLDFVKSRKIVLPILLLALVGGITYSLVTHFNFAVDFTGGTSITINTTDDISLGDYTINKIDRTKDSTNIVINEKLTKEEIEALSNKLEEEYHTTSNIYVVSDMVKKQLIKNAIMAVIISLIGIIIYVSFRFRFNYAISGIVALMHDALITIIFFGVFKLQIDSVFIAAILTIIGYSINDTIVTFDMIRRNYNERKIKNKDDLPELVNDSVRLTFFRSLMTTATTIVPIICLIVLGSHEILNFNIALLVGFIAGVFSSIYISNSLWLMLESKRLSKPKKDVKKKVEKEEMQIKGINC